MTDYIKEQNEDTGYDRSVEQKMNQGGGAGGASGGSDRGIPCSLMQGRFIIEKDKASIGMLSGCSRSASTGLPGSWISWPRPGSWERRGHQAQKDPHVHGRV